jgi:hypothetical protein
MITRLQYERACYLVDKYDAAEVFGQWMYPHKQGRRSALTPRTFLIGSLLAIEEEHSMRYDDVYRVLTVKLPPSAMVELGVAERGLRDDGQRVARVTLTMDSFYNFTRTLRKRCGGGRNGSTITPEDKTALLDVLNRILRATHPTRPKGAKSYAVDESGVWAWSRGYNKPAKLEELEEGNREPVPDQMPSSVDREAAWHKKTSKNGPDEYFFGYSLHGIVRAPKLGSDYAQEPYILQRLDLTPASSDIVDATLGMIDAIVRDGTPVSEIIGDRHYSYKKEHRWADQLHARRIRQVFDLRSDETRFSAGPEGTRIVAGVPHCPATPDHLNELSRPGPPPGKAKHVTDIEHEEKKREHQRRVTHFRTGIKERAAFALQFHGWSQNDSRDSRWQCPAMAGKVGCPLRPGTVQVAQANGLPTVHTPPEAATAPKPCSAGSGTVTFKHTDIGTKHRQQHYWGSADWEISYARRTYVEGFFGTLKNASVANLRRDAFRGDCLGLRLIHTGLSCVVTNVRLVRSWHKKHGNRLDLPDVLIAEDARPTEFLLDESEAA